MLQMCTLTNQYLDMQYLLKNNPNLILGENLPLLEKNSWEYLIFFFFYVCVYIPKTINIKV